MTKSSNGERRFRIPRPSAGVIIGTIALLVALSGVANSAVPSPGGKIHACYLIDPDPDFSYVYIVDHDVNCQSGEQRITWDQEGADQNEVAAADTLAGKAQASLGSLSATIADLEGFLKRLGTPKVSKPKSNILNPFKKKQANGLAGLLSTMKKNDRAQARFNKSLREGLITMQGLIKNANDGSKEINDALVKAISGIRIGP